VVDVVDGELDAGVGDGEATSLHATVNKVKEIGSQEVIRVLATRLAAATRRRPSCGLD
jgi:hypothetical protein